MIKLHSTILEDEYTSYIKEHYDFDAQKANEVNVPSFHLPNTDWNIIAIIGASGSGKSTILNELGNMYGGVTKPHFDSRPIISNLGLPPKEASELLCAIGLASVPSWCRPLHNLSNGEQYRAKLAQIISQNDISFVDEFTSVIDRNSAKAMSNALQKYIRRNNKKIVLASCHYDIIPFLAPDYIFDLNKGGVLERGDCLPQPSIPLRLYRVESDTWRIFAKHHYMSSEHNDSAQCFVAQWDDKPVAFCSTLSLFGKGIVNSVRVHRLVVLPDYQGLGISRQLLSAIGGIYKNNGTKLYIKSVNPAIGFALQNDSRWSPTAFNGRRREGIEHSDPNKTDTHQSRPSFCFRYDGPPIQGFDNLILPIDKIRRIRGLEGQLSLF